MSTQAVVTLTRPGRHVRGTFKLGDLALRMMAGLVLLFLFVPILVIIVFSFNKPAGKFNYTWQGFTLDNWAHPFKSWAPWSRLHLCANASGEVKR